jgi:hypothetical protein
MDKSTSEEQLRRLRSELAALTSDAFERSGKCQFWALLWQVTDLVVGLTTAILAAVAGATGLASTAGRIPAAIMALAAAALAAATRFLRSSERYERNWRRRVAWQHLGYEARFASAADGYPGAQNLYDSIQDLLKRRVAIMEMDHLPLPPEVVRKQSENNP